MPAAALDEVMDHGTYHKFRITVINERTAAVTNISSWSKFWCTGKIAKTDADDDAVFQLTSPAAGIAILDAANGLIEITIPCTILADAADFGATTHLYIDVRGLDPAGCPWGLARGRLTVLGETTRAQS